MHARTLCALWEYRIPSCKHAHHTTLRNARFFFHFAPQCPFKAFAFVYSPAHEPPRAARRFVRAQSKQKFTPRHNNRIYAWHGHRGKNVPIQRIGHVRLFIWYFLSFHHDSYSTISVEITPPAHATHAPYAVLVRPRRSHSISFASASIMMRTSSSNFVFADHPSFAFTFVVSAIRLSTSVGR